jgi:hypothetical protein
VAAPNVPYSGPWYGPNGKGKTYRGPAAVALKRAVSRWNPKVLPWKVFNNQYNVRLENALKKFQRAHDIRPTGQTGLATFKALRRETNRKGQPAMDSVAVNLFEDAWAIKNPPKPPNIVIVREALAEFLREMELYNYKWWYSQLRPNNALGDDPDEGGRGDCSTLEPCGTYMVRAETGLFVPDPTGYGYSGWGNTQSILNNLRERKVTNGQYEVGDCALYGPAWQTRHMSMCRQRGTAQTAIFTSHGSQSAPYATRLWYRGDVLGVYRPVLVPS